MDEQSGGRRKGGPAIDPGAAGGWRLIREEARPGAYHMALDEVAAETVAAGGPPTVRTYRWSPSALSLGYAQASDTVAWAYCDREGIDVVRRPTGGGGIYHDHVGDISYSIVAPASSLPGDLMASYERLCEPILAGFGRLGIDADFATTRREPVLRPSCYLRGIDPAHDVVVSDGDGVERKISGNAQHRRRAAVVQHGSITYAREPERHLAAFAGHDVEPSRFRDRVTSVREQAGIDRATAVAAFERALASWVDATEGSWTPSERRRARGLVDAKYATASWTRDRRDPRDGRGDRVEPGHGAGDGSENEHGGEP